MQLKTFLSIQKVGQIHQLLHFISVDKKTDWFSHVIMFTIYSKQFSDFAAGISNTTPGHN